MFPVLVLFKSTRLRGNLPALALSALLSGCATSTSGDMFDVPVTRQATKLESGSPQISRSGKQEETPTFVASELLPTTSGPGYEIAETVSNDGRYYLYSIKADGRDYKVIGSSFLEYHLQEIEAVNVLKQKNKALALARGATNSVIEPTKAILTTVTRPVATARNTVGNVKNTAGKIGRGASTAAKVVATFKLPPKQTAEREESSFVSDFTGRAEVRRDLAISLKVDPHTHYRPLQQQLNGLANFSTAGRFGVDLGLNFVPGAAGFVITGVGLVDTLTSENLNLPAEALARRNKKSLTEAGYEKAAIEKLLRNPVYTPTEKTLLTQQLVRVSSLTGANTLLVSLGAKETRSDAFESIQSTAFLIRNVSNGDPLKQVTSVEGLPVALSGDNKVTVFAPYDHMFWTADVANQMRAISEQLIQSRKNKSSVEFVLTGKASPLALRQLKAFGWRVTDNSL